MQYTIVKQVPKSSVLEMVAIRNITHSLSMTVMMTSGLDLYA